MLEADEERKEEKRKEGRDGCKNERTNERTRAVTTNLFLCVHSSRTSRQEKVQKNKFHFPTEISRHAQGLFERLLKSLQARTAFHVCSS